MIIIDNKYDVGEHVYLTNDKESQPLIVVAVCVQVGGTLRYEVQGVGASRWCYELELTREPVIV